MVGGDPAAGDKLPLCLDFALKVGSKAIAVDIEGEGECRRSTNCTLFFEIVCVFYTYLRIV